MAATSLEIRALLIIPQVAATETLAQLKTETVAAPVTVVFMADTQHQGCLAVTKLLRPYMFLIRTCKISRDKQWRASSSKRFNPTTLTATEVISRHNSRT
jgi:hypothetical protein